MASLQEILASVSNIAEQAGNITSSVQAIALPTISAGAPQGAGTEMTTDGDPAENPVNQNPMMKWYIGIALALVVLYFVLRK